jgi:anti-anti-sigma regulatory factor
MSEPATVTPDYRDALTRTRTQRMRTFVVTLMLLDLPLFVIGLFDLPKSPVTLILVSIAFVYYVIYYQLIRAGYGVPATYVCVVLLVVLISAGVHNGGGFLLANSALYFLLLVAVGLVLDEPRAIDATLVACLIGYGSVAFYELTIEPPEAFASLYQNPKLIAVAGVVLSILLPMVGVWRLMRSSVVSLIRSTSAIERARLDAENRARENAELVAQAQVNNEMLRSTEARLRATIDALALPLIPLEQGIALLPLVGYVDERRAAQLVERLLQGVQEQRIRAVVIDITGLRAIDERVAVALIQTAQAARLLGAEVVLSGIGADAAQALVALDTNLTMLQTSGSLSNALRMLTTQRADAIDRR